MKTTKYEKSKFTSRGFYITLAICLLAVGVATAIAISQTVKDTQNTPLENIPNTSIDGNVQAADTEQNDVPKEEESSSNSNAQNSSAAANSNETTAATKFAMPLDGEIINEFSNGNLVKNETMGDFRTHDGIDIASQEGTPVKSCADGKVIEISENPMWGICIVIDHGNYTSYYYGLNKTVQVKMDQQVKLGDVIGSVGSTNQLELSEEPHLHFGMKKDNQWIDPLSVIQQ